jgi:hypothetical protein
MIVQIHIMWVCTRICMIILHKWYYRKHKLNAIQIKFIYSEKASKFCEIFTLLLTVCTVVKSKVKISQNFVAFIWTLATYVHIYRFNFNFNSNLNLNFNFNFNFNFLLKIWIEFLEFPLG